jgi:hypothetical protein
LREEGFPIRISPEMETISTTKIDELLAAMIQSAEGISDLLFVTNRTPQVEVHGRLKPTAPESPESVLTSARIEGLAKAIINNNARLLEDLAETMVRAIAVIPCRRLPFPRQHLPAERQLRHGAAPPFVPGFRRWKN